MAGLVLFGALGWATAGHAWAQEPMAPDPPSGETTVQQAPANGAPAEPSRNAPPLLQADSRVWPEGPVLSIGDVQVAMLLEIDASGAVQYLESVFCSHPDAGFEEAAEIAVARWRFEPGRREGSSVGASWGAVLLFLRDPEGGTTHESMDGPPWLALLDAGRRELLSGRPGSALEVLDQARGLATADGVPPTALGRVQAVRGRTLVLSGRTTEGEAELIEAIDRLSAVTDERFPEEADALSALAMLRVNQDRRDEALPFLELWVARARAQEPVDPQEIAASHGALGRMYLESGELAKAEPLLQTVVDLGDAADLSGFTSGLALETLFLLRMGQRDLDGAEALVATFLERVEALGDPLALRQTREKIAFAFRSAGEPVRAARVWRTAVAELEAGGEESPDWVPELLALGASEAEAGEMEAADAAFRRALRLAKSAQPRDLATLAEVEFAIGHLTVAMGNLGRGEEHLLEAAEYYALIEPTASPGHAGTMMELGMLRGSLGDFAAACDYFSLAAEITQEQSGASIDLVPPLLHLSACELKRGDLEEADARSRRALAILDSAPNPPRDLLMQLLSQRVTLLQAMQRDEEAAEVERRLRSLALPSAGG